MADYNAIRKTFEEDEELNKNLDKKIDTNNTLYDNKKDAVIDTYSGQIKDSNLAYEDAYRENSVQKKINEFYIKEDMANMGLSDSGLSRSQITANQLSYSNQKADIDRQRQSMVDGLTREMTSMLSGIEDERFSTEQSIRESDSQYRDSLATAQYNTDTEAETAKHKADVEAETKRQEYYYDYLTEQGKTDAETAENNQKDKSNEYSNLYSHLSENGGDDYDYSAQMIDTYLQKYDIDPDTNAGRAELNALLKAAGITYDEFLYYVDNGSIYVPASKYDPKNPQGITKFNYKTDGKADYVIKVEKDTVNWGLGVDNNDVVRIYYADGKTPVVDGAVKLGDLSKDLGKQLSGMTKGNEGKTIRIKNVDLSKEDF